MLRYAFTLSLAVFLASPLAAQTRAPGEPDPALVRLRIGPLLLRPTIALTNLGVDTNVFNEADINDPKRDFTLTFTPQADIWLRMGRTWLTGNIKEEAVWFRKYASERSSNNSYSAGWIAPLTRVTFNVAGTWLETRERPGFEIDARSQRTEGNYSAGIELRALSKTLIGVRGARRNVDFDSDAVYLGRSLREQLNRTETLGAITVRHELTPLTTIVLDVSRQQDRFEFLSLRDADSTHAALRVQFDPYALISGSAQVGYRDFNPLTPGVPGFEGATASVNLSYTALGATKVGVQLFRDIQYSYEVTQPFYLLTGVQGSLAQHIYGPVDVEARLGRQRLAYRERAGAQVELPNRVDYVRTYGASIGYRMGRDIRIAFNADVQNRATGVVQRQYDGVRYGTSVTYGL